MDALGAVGLVAASAGALLVLARRRIGAVVMAAGWLGVAAALLWAFARTDLHVAAVADFGRSDQALWARVASAWAGPEGSLVLWSALVMVALSAVLWRNGDSSRPAAAPVVGAVGLVAVVLVLDGGALVHLGTAPLRGGGLVPVLEHPMLAVHPPVLYATQAVVVACAFTTWSRPAAGMRAARPLALCALALGIASSLLGAWWAHDEIGWGGWWAWDPVENTALAPMAALLAALHSRSATTAGRWHLAAGATVFAGIALTRSGLAMSVHAFSAGGLAPWVFLGAAALTAVAALRWRPAAQDGSPTIDRQGGARRAGGLRSSAAISTGLVAAWVLLVVGAVELSAAWLGTRSPAGAPDAGLVGRLFIPVGIALALGIVVLGLRRRHGAAVLCAHIGVLVFLAGAALSLTGSTQRGWVTPQGSNIAGLPIEVVSIDTTEEFDRRTAVIVLDVHGTAATPRIVRHTDLDATRARPALIRVGSSEVRVTATALNDDAVRIEVTRDPGILWVWAGGVVTVAGLLAAVSSGRPGPTTDDGTTDTPATTDAPDTTDIPDTTVGQSPDSRRRRRFASSSDAIDESS